MPRAMMERYRIFMKRFQWLSEDFASSRYEQLKTQLGQFGITPQQMFEQVIYTAADENRFGKKNSHGDFDFLINQPMLARED